MEPASRPGHEQVIHAAANTDPPGTDWYRFSAEHAAARLGTEPASGLTESDARTRLDEYGPNEVEDRGGRCAWRVLLAQFSGVLVPNPALVGALLLSMALQLAAVYAPFLQKLFGTTALPLRDLVLAFAAAAGVLLAVEAWKWGRRHPRRQPADRADSL
jgi:magnesium-transporting ATPase (P-type)